MPPTIVDTVIENDYDGIIIDETNTNFLMNTSATLHNRSKQLIVSVTYTENLDLYGVAPYIDKLILKVPSQDTYTIESAILDTRLQIPETKIIIELSSNAEIQDILNNYNITYLRNEVSP